MSLLNKTFQDYEIVRHFSMPNHDLNEYCIFVHDYKCKTESEFDKVITRILFLKCTHVFLS